jgi:hypothetical protein
MLTNVTRLSACLVMYYFEDTAMSPDNSEIIYMLIDKCSARTKCEGLALALALALQVLASLYSFV